MRLRPCSCLPLMALNESCIPSIMGLSSVISVQMAATPMVPAPMKRTLFFQSESAYDAMSMSAGCGATDEK